jgi:type I restriction enzyme, S subunit
LGLEVAGADLPEGWITSKLSGVCEINPPKPSRDALPPNSRVSFVPMPAVDADCGAITAARLKPFSEVRRGYTAFRDNDVIFAKITPCMENGKSAIARGLQNGLGFGSTEFHVLRPSGAVLPEYLYYLIRQESFRRAAEEHMTGSVGQRRVPAEYLERVQFPLPPLAEQRRIVEKVEALLARVNAARDRLAKVPAILKRFRQSVLAAACSGRLTEDWRQLHPKPVSEGRLLGKLRATRRSAWETAESLRLKARGKLVSRQELGARYRVPIEAEPTFQAPAGWILASLDELTFLAGGITKGQKRPAGIRLRKVPYLRVANVQRGYLDLSEVKQIEATEDEIRELRLRPGDILLNEGGDIDKLGRGWVWNGEIDECIHQNHVFRARPIPGIIEPRFLSHYANTFGQQFFFDVGAQTVNLASVSMSKVKALPVPVPPIEEQAEIVRWVDRLLKLADVIERRVAAATAHANSLTQAVLAKAFRGELVPTEAELARREGRDYEPASALLERVKGATSRAGARRRGGLRE